ncbi:MAG TPA: PxxKW family cysteine-rich protein [Syntrophales bacterium]|nr:PxxKW family cysteine-rich protein [Syntrophales bacterium]HOD98542.1 PxxKW family cysteine-rich protein [Syntrophales bacterium]HOH73027.1 PxxKW family cysteine-rich protein [Syntrophales bacterium]HPX81390.1 PxxKW family cysteine-rich protein [Syntrophales bacterium]HQB13026.1 PxxKW family cysteine-rich protein [Syntrophales bacterium]
MICQTIRTGADCVFMKSNGCAFKDGACKTIVEKCEGCGKIVELATGRFCQVYMDPASRWLMGNCPRATHVKLVIKENTQKINPLKASKRASRAKKKK